ncbi:phospholipase D family protein [Xanthomonas albilineans]|uniref:Putative phospholipase protein n=1 Tax=Xanthomonas albilineans (strain GPE PC73 / CFBP 7063) TaxID=380358 RepID=D2UGR6_XANAP|nr:phospholipase D family protein [Xanthomonas albilineans]CBA17577.1 putative phospholipase protein [Xanthomonas albilineans GPE PC73]
MTVLIRGVVLAVLLLASGCATLSHTQHARALAIAEAAQDRQLTCTRSDHCALASPLRGLAAKAFAQSSGGAPHHYAIILDHGEEALVARINLIRSASHSIDLQTYIFDKDDSARLVMDELLDAARRGVKVRVLIDQLSAISDLQILGALAGAHENFSLRIYNPTFGLAKTNYLHYAASVLCCFRHFNQRMHNKLLVVDEAIGVAGGRNYQDDYFDWDSEYNFRDRDVLVAGPVARTMAASFDTYWEARRSVPVARLNDVGKMLLRDGVPVLPPAQFLRPERVQRVSQEAADPAFVENAFVLPALPVEHVDYVADLPQKHRREHGPKAISTAPRLDHLIAEAREEILLQTPYLVLSDPAQAIFRDLRKRAHPPRVVVASNSLASTDNPVVYALSYKYKRRNLRALGLDIYEYMPFPLDAPVDYANLLPAPLRGELPDGETVAVPTPVPSAPVGGSADKRLSLLGSGSGGPSGSRGDGSQVERRLLRTETRPYLSRRIANHPLPVTREGARMGVHAKSLVVDRRVGVIGSHNFDPRSETYNTEGAVIVDDPAFAQALAASIDRDIEPENSWVVAPRIKPPLLSGLNYSIDKLSESLPVLDLWPWRYATDYAFQPGPDCPAPLTRHDPGFHRCYIAVGDFPEVDVGPKWLLVRMLTAFGSGLVPIL